MNNTTDNKIVLDQGSYYIKYGFSGYNKPLNKMRTKIYEHKVTKQILLFEDINMINNIDLNQYKQYYPIKNTIIINFDKMIYLWDRIFEHLKVDTSTCNLLLSEPIFTSANYIERLTQILLTRYKFKRIEFCNQQLLGLYGSCSDKGIVIDIGYCGIRIVPIYDSYIITEAIILLPLSKVTFLSKNKDNNNNNINNINYQDFLFNPNLLDIDSDNITQALVKSINLCPIDLRKKISSNVVVIGGGSMMLNFDKRLKEEIMFINSIIVKSICIITLANRHVLTWLGGSIACSLYYFKN